MLEKDNRTETLSLSTGVDNDEGLLASLGYKQELKRQFKPLEIFGIAFSIIGIAPALSSVLIYSLPNGGAFAMVWGWTVCSIFIAAIALAMGDLASAAPTSGGLYYWTFMFSSDKWRCFLCWIVGYSNTISNVASVASIDWGCALQIMAAVSIGSDLIFEATIPQTFGLYCALLLCHALICSINPRFMAKLQVFFVILNILLCFAIIIGLPAATPKEFRNDAKFAFEDFTNVSGWPNGFAFILSFLTPLWGVGCFDAPVHMSEEATNASMAVPMAIIFSTFAATILGWGEFPGHYTTTVPWQLTSLRREAMNISLVFCMGRDYQSIIDSPIGQPMATIFFNSFGRTGTLIVWSFIILAQFAIGAGILTTCSRQIFAFSRDGGFPLSRWVYYVNPRTRIPSHAVWFGTFLSLLLGILAFAGENAIGAVFSLVITGQYVSYSIPMAARFLGGKTVQPGPFRLGLFSLPVAAIAVTWMIFMTVVFMFPLTPSPGVGNMNYTVVVQGGVLVLSAVYFYFPKYGGVYWFKGPVSTVEAPAVQVKDGEDEKE
ncbi:related to UGA4-GABA permease-also involved in delta-aminolevulinate transport [Armillaria ostoyae]|uniref:Related to UGA4-GABA permease-also involved in delta-aminolevulinate transport n=1 Tax=Armillaria ostoyae TaxID=47428 RepID=A0A284QWD0_ARMOS|nr:related to UGA4-GABA permease-also involved in delta-aminolevulinate transport [Armillaria ostoyae]